ncbi:hypothetical protein QCA50_017744 [Cerrena zonata]|uniref:Uncharacterized protein n=1 Tax=Cerrena zonata TaxID=2478898 RepID=A0AAW0FEL0_9APHY
MSHRQFRCGSCQSLVQPTRSNCHVSFAQNDEVIILPSDDERSTKPKKHRRRAAKGATTRLRPATPPPIEDVIEISLGDETLLKDPSDSIVDMRLGTLQLHNWRSRGGPGDSWWSRETTSTIQRIDIHIYQYNDKHQKDDD